MKRISKKASKEKEVMNIIEELKQEGIEINTDKYTNRGQQGMVTLIEMELTNKFKSVPNEYSEKLKKLNVDELKLIGTKVLEIEDIQELKEYLY